MTFRTDQELMQQASAMTSQAIAHSLGESACAKLQADTHAAVFHDEIMSLRAAIGEMTAVATANEAALQTRIDHLTAQLKAAGIEPEAAPEAEPHAIVHPDEDPGAQGSAAMLHPAGAPAAHPDHPDHVAPERLEPLAETEQLGDDAILGHAAP